MTMTMEGLGAMAIGVLVLIVAFTIIPIVGDQLDNAVTIPGYTNETAKTGGSQWNSTVNSDIPTGVDLWQSVGWNFESGWDHRSCSRIFAYAPGYEERKLKKWLYNHFFFPLLFFIS